MDSRHSRRTLPPGFIVPCAPELRDNIPSVGDWTHEVKHDGYRLIARRDSEHVHLWTRTAAEYREHFTGIASALLALPTGRVTLDGEAVILKPDGRSDFGALRSRARANEAVFIAFDILVIDDDLRAFPIEQRRTRLTEVLAERPAHIIQAQVFHEPSSIVLRHVCEANLEGVVSKRARSRYRSGASPDWIKVRCPAYAAILADRFENWNK